ncbi:MAG: hypothetical protein FWG78_00920 [Coriobacteriia bacterium]|nr:hypothetical protein [Coriobacteriia bacterium]
MAFSHKRFVPKSLASLLATVAVFAAITFGGAALVTGPAFVFSDSMSYSIAAQRLIHTGTFEMNGIPELEVQSGPSAWTMPGYTLFLAPVYAAIGLTDDVLTNVERARPIICTLQYLLAVSSAVALAGCGFLIAGTKGAGIAGVLTALYLPLGINAMYIGTETVAFFGTALCLLCALLMLYASSRKQALIWSVCYGIAGGILVMVRPTILPWLVVPFLFFVWSRRKDLPTAAMTVGVWCMAVAVIMSPWIIRNAVVFNQFIPLMTASSSPLLESTGATTFSSEEEEIARQAEQDGEDANRAVAHHRLMQRWQASRRNFVLWKIEALYASSIQYPHMPRANQHMYTAIFDLPEKEREGYNLAVVESSRHQNPERVGEKVLDWYTTWYHRVLLVGAFLGLVFSYKKRDAWLLASLPLFFFAAHSYFLVEPRYLYYNVTAYVLLTTLGIVSVMGWAHARR